MSTSAMNSLVNQTANRPLEGPVDQANGQLSLESKVLLVTKTSSCSSNASLGTHGDPSTPLNEGAEPNQMLANPVDEMVDRAVGRPKEVMLDHADGSSNP